MNKTHGFHIEQPMVPSTASQFEELKNADSLDGFSFRNKRTLNYTDSFWDTSEGDLHASGLLLRSRSRNQKETDFLDYKGSPIYLLQTLFARPLVSEKITDSRTLSDAIELRRQSAPIQALYEDRPDLIGKKLQKLTNVSVSRQNVDLFTDEEIGFCTLSFHEFSYGGARPQDGLLVEIQPYCKAQVLTSRLPAIFKIASKALSSRGFQSSPTSKFHRISRKEIDALSA